MLRDLRTGDRVRYSPPTARPIEGFYQAPSLESGFIAFIKTDDGCLVQIRDGEFDHLEHVKGPWDDFFRESLLKLYDKACEHGEKRAFCRQALQPEKDGGLGFSFHKLERLLKRYLTDWLEKNPAVKPDGFTTEQVIEDEFRLIVLDLDDELG